ncbi:hypothetical protein THASP1DRAFT_26494 [Thamnocephalis sphaerospora]|uniref:Uncharacterized protein n=1 Tax=Thamnocephalis sphaerospora TaxID=78915 RepID=A0A4P9XH11_9FUNG|nr:hypothetical protein THASP1DRAFT_26494 [Thamnocephalis sphaerospora]|eukprot:RKP04944.1 hypothetical protein THASP1DRAFT_26494 [Thamnocephalis sphaerospora]
MRSISLLGTAITAFAGFALMGSFASAALFKLPFSGPPKNADAAVQSLVNNDIFSLYPEFRYTTFPGIGLDVKNDTQGRASFIDIPKGRETTRRTIDIMYKDKEKVPFIANFKKYAQDGLTVEDSKLVHMRFSANRQRCEFYEIVNHDHTRVQVTVQYSAFSSTGKLSVKDISNGVTGTRNGEIYLAH